MSRPPRNILTGCHYHVVSRAIDRATLFHEPSGYHEFAWLMCRALARVRLSLVAACVMPNHVHLVATAARPSDFTRWLQWLFATHGRRFNARTGRTGHVWQGRYKSFLIQDDAHLLTVMRYVERNALRAALVRRAEDWPWGSLAWRLGTAQGPTLAEPPVTLPLCWADYVNEPQSAGELAALRECVNRQRPYGAETWVQAVAGATRGHTPRRDAPDDPAVGSNWGQTPSKSGSDPVSTPLPAKPACDPAP